MSYIRSTSNPEGMYIWSNGKTTHISVGTRPSLLVPHEVWNGFLEKCLLLEYWEDEEREYKGLAAKEILPGKIFISYPSWESPVEMYYTTWYYILHSNARRYE